MSAALDALIGEIRACRLCAGDFGYEPRPVIRIRNTARILIAGQAPGARVHHSGLPFDDPSGERLRAWMGIGREAFYDERRIAIAPMAFCFPGTDERGADRPPPRICAATWRARLMALMPAMRLTLLAGAYAQDFHLGRGPSLTARVAAWRDHAPGIFVTPHPSWRNTAWLKRHPWFEAELVPALQTAVRDALA